MTRRHPYDLDDLYDLATGVLYGWMLWEVYKLYRRKRDDR